MSRILSMCYVLNAWLPSVINALWWLAPASPEKWQIPIAIDPWMRFHPGWAEAYQVFNVKHGFEFVVGSGIKLETEASSELSYQSFNATQERMGRQENPNYEYPPGHYLPFPMHLLEMEATGDGFIQFNIQ